jgi:hypothetical protein
LNEPRDEIAKDDHPHEEIPIASSGCHVCSDIARVKISNTRDECGTQQGKNAAH